MTQEDQLRIVCDIDVPKGATHYRGQLASDPTYLKRKIDSRDKWTTWWYWCAQRQTWLLDCQGAEGFMPPWTKELEYADQTPGM